MARGWSGARCAGIDFALNSLGFEVGWVAQGMRVVKSERDGTRSDMSRSQSLSGAGRAQDNYD